MDEALGPVPPSPEFMTAEVIQPHIHWGLHLRVLQPNQLIALEPMAKADPKTSCLPLNRTLKRFPKMWHYASTLHSWFESYFFHKTMFTLTCDKFIIITLSEVSKCS